ncbi:MAG TPA: secretin N-terminal domain-containing protein [Candidatus Eisenbacteria bacterium]|nr:secretin N-terminal domain-containing protein [Candidatus Eisenbacteria bacterium]
MKTCTRSGKLRLAGIFLFFLFSPLASMTLCVPASAEDQPAAAEAAPSDAPAAPAADATSPTAATSPGNVTVDFKEADIQNVLRILSFKSGVNIVAGKDVTGVVTIRLVDVPWEKALDVVLKTYGYAYDRDGNIIRVTTLENLKKEELSTEVFTLNYSQSAEVEKSLKDILSERGKMRSDSRSNTIIVTDMPTTLQRVSKVIERLDRVTPQVMISAKVIETTLGSTDKLGIKWNIKATIKGAARPITAPFPANGPENQTLRRFLPEGRGAQIEQASVGTSSSTSTATVQDFPTPEVPHESDFPVSDKNEFTFGTLDFTQFQAVLEMIQQRDDAKVLSEPHVITLNNQEAKILVGEVIAIPTFERNSTTGRMEITGYQDRDLGIRLSVVPQINAANEIVVDIHPEITNLLGFDDLTTDIKAPRFSTREAKTQVRIKNGQTIAIGGLIRENVIDTKTKVPVLGDIPLLQNLFSHTDKTVQKTDLLFFMTVNVVPDKAEPPQGHPL